MSAPLESAEPCMVHGRHHPIPRLCHRHHVWPLGNGGPDTDDNIVIVCPTGHVNIHALLTAYLAHQGQPPYSDERRYSFHERRIARLGFERITRGAM